MKKLLKIMFKEIGRILALLAIPTFSLYVGILGRKGIDFSHRFRAEKAEMFIEVAIVGYIAVTIGYAYQLYHEYYLPYKKRKAQQPQEEPASTQEKQTTLTQTTVNEDKKSTYRQKIVSPCKNIMTVVIVLLIVRFIIPQESWFLNIIFLGFFSYWLRCMYKAKKNTKDIE
jgi:hypothetical protein